MKWYSLRYVCLTIAVAVIWGAAIGQNVPASAPRPQPETMLTLSTRNWDALAKSEDPQGPRLTPAQMAELGRQVQDAFPVMDAALRKAIEDHVRGCRQGALLCNNFDVGPDREKIGQRLAAAGLPYLEAIPTGAALNILDTLGPWCDAQGNEMTAKTAPEWRRRYTKSVMDVWLRAHAAVDLNYKYDAPENFAVLNVLPPDGYLPGTPPEAVKDPEVRKRYQAAIEENYRRSVRNGLQADARRDADDSLRMLKANLPSLYVQHRVPVSEEDAEVLKALLRVYVDDAKLREELLTLALKKPAEVGK